MFAGLFPRLGHSRSMSRRSHFDARIIFIRFGDHIGTSPPAVVRCNSRVMSSV